jgi:Zn-finger nucleic acid-binding protein
MKCPECGTRMQQTHDLPKKGEVGVNDWDYETVFECPKCKGVWLYYGGVKKIGENLREKPLETRSGEK